MTPERISAPHIMATQRQIEANRRNARKSTGPRTPEGKQRSSWNSLRHGLAAGRTLLPHEDSREFDRVRSELIESWQPANAQELMLVEQIVSGFWRMQRSRRFEAALFELEIRTLKRLSGADQAPHPSDDGAVAASLSDSDNEDGYRTFFRYDTRAESSYYRALDHLQKLQSARLRRESKQLANGCTTTASAQSASFGTPHTEPEPNANAATPGAEPAEALTTDIASQPRWVKSPELRHMAMYPTGPAEFLDTPVSVNPTNPTPCSN